MSDKEHPGEKKVCPDLEDLAAFVDGNVDAETRAQMLAHLDTCERCFEVVSETLRFQEEELQDSRAVDVGSAVAESPAEESPVEEGPAGESPVEENLPSPYIPVNIPVIRLSYRRFWPGLAAAAVLTLLLLQPRRERSQPGAIAQRVVDHTEIRSLPVFRSGNGPSHPPLTRAERPFVLGVKTVEVELTAQLKKDLLPECSELSDLALSLDFDPEDSEACRRAHLTLIRDFGEDADYFLLGQWVGGAEHARGEKGAAAYFADRQVQRLLRRLIRSKHLSPEKKRHLQEVQQLLADGLSPKEMGDMDQLLRELAYFEDPEGF